MSCPAPPISKLASNTQIACRLNFPLGPPHPFILSTPECSISFSSSLDLTFLATVSLRESSIYSLGRHLSTPSKPVNFKYSSAQLLRTLRNREIIHPQYISCAFDALFQDYIAWFNFDAAIRSLCTCSATHFSVKRQTQGKSGQDKAILFYHMWSIYLSCPLRATSNTILL